MSKTILIIEPIADGHHMHYVRYAAIGILNAGNKVMLATFEESLRNPSYTEMQQACGNRIKVIPITQKMERSWSPGPAGTLARHFSFYRLFKNFWRTSAEAQEADIVFMAYLDYCDKIFSLLGSPFGTTPWAGLLMRPSFHYKTMGVIAPSSPLDTPERMLMRRLLRIKHLRTLFTIDEPLSLYVRKFWPEYAAKMKYVLDPADLEKPIPQPEARSLFGLPMDKRVMLVYGSLSLRKGVDILLQAAKSPDFPDDMILFLGGKQDSDVQALLNSSEGKALIQCGKLIEVNRYLHKAEQTAAFCASDVVWLGYRDHYSSSGVLAQAQALNMPIIGCREGIIGWTLNKYNNGYVMEDMSVSSILNAIEKRCDKERHPQREDFNDRFSITRFGADIQSGLQ
jgi:glycosyltransferase involved in cell wall biosynthesis